MGPDGEDRRASLVERGKDVQADDRGIDLGSRKVTPICCKRGKTLLESGPLFDY
jgi:hypothetical protein